MASLETYILNESVMLEANSLERGSGPTYVGPCLCNESVYKYGSRNRFNIQIIRPTYQIYFFFNPLFNRLIFYTRSITLFIIVCKEMKIKSSKVAYKIECV